MPGKVQTVWVQADLWKALDVEAARIKDSSAPKFLTLMSRVGLLGLPYPVQPEPLVRRIMTHLLRGPATSVELAAAERETTEAVAAALESLAEMLPGEVVLRDMGGSAVWTYCPAVAELAP